MSSRAMMMAGGVCATTAFAGPPEYRVVLLNPPTSASDRANTTVSRLTEFGDVLGQQIITDTDSHAHFSEAFVWLAGDLAIVQPPEGYHRLLPIDLDEAGRLLAQGIGPNAPCSRGLVRVGGVWTELTPIDGFPCSIPRGLTGDSRVVGTSFSPPSDVATVWNQDGEPVAPVPFVLGTFSWISGVDGDGTVYGLIARDDLLDWTTWSWDGGAPNPILPPAGYTELGPIRVNAVGERYTHATRADGSRAVVLVGDDGYEELANLPQQTWPIDMNASRTVLAIQTGGSPASRPVLIRGNRVDDLADLVQPGIIDARYFDASDINDDGWIVGVGGVWSGESLTTLGVLLIPACPADFDLDDDADNEDIVSFLAAFAVEDHRADRDRSGVLDFADVLTFVVAFASGCP